jgi:glycosyltransferase involved in cell wall biosynthesis
MHCDVPIITSNTSSLAEVAGEAGYLVNPTDIKAIAAAMTDLYQNPQKCLELVSHGQRQRLDFTWEIAVEHIEKGIISICL